MYTRTVALQAFFEFFLNSAIVAALLHVDKIDHNQAGQVTQAVLQHRGAGISLRLVSRPGGDPIANTAWSVFTEDGDKVFTSRLVSPFLILAEGAYEAVVRNGDDDYRRTFVVRSGKNARIEVLLE